MSGILAVYALVVAVLIAGNMKPPPQTYSLFQGFLHLACGLSVGLTGLAAGYAIGKVGDTVGTSGTKLLEDRYADSWRPGCEKLHATIANFCGNGVDTHLRRGPGTLRVSITASDHDLL